MIWILIALGWLFPRDAHAYVDPGTGAYLIQALIALVGALVFYLRHPVELLKKLWSKIRRR